MRNWQGRDPSGSRKFFGDGYVVSDLVHHYSRTMILDLKDATADQIDAIFRELESLGRGALDSDGIPAERQGVSS